MQSQLKDLVEKFNRTVRPHLSPGYWQKASQAFDIFWNNKIMTGSLTPTEGREIDDLHPIVRLLDPNGKKRYRDFTNEKERLELRERLLASGRQYGLEYGIEENQDEVVIATVDGVPLESVAKTMVHQDEWNRIFFDLSSNPALRSKLDQIFKETDLGRRALLVDELKSVNEQHKNFLTKPSASALCAILSLQDPVKNVQVVSLNHRKMVIDYFELGVVDANESYGKRIVHSNDLLLSFVKKFSVDFSPVELSYFLYTEEVKALWNPEQTDDEAVGDVDSRDRTKIENDELTVCDVVNFIKADRFTPERIQVREESEDRASEILKNQLGHVTLNDLATVIDLLNSDYYDNEKHLDRFGLGLRGNNRQLILGNDVKKLNELILQVYGSENLQNIDDLVRNLKGIKDCFISGLLYLKNREEYNMFMSRTASGIEAAYPEDAPVTQATFKERYTHFNRLAQKLREECEVAPQEMDVVLANLAETMKDLNVSDEHETKEEAYFVLITGSKEYDDSKERYHFKKGIPGYNQLLEAEHKGKFVYYQEGKFYAKGEIGEITSEDKEETTYYYAKVENYEEIGPIKFEEIRNNLSFGYVGAAGIRKISKEDYFTITSKTPAVSGEFIKKDLELPDDFTLDPLLFADKETLELQIASALKAGNNVMLVGPPGTGKTEVALLLGKQLTQIGSISGFVMTTATSDWTTFDTIGGYVPRADGKGLDFQPGLFLRCFRDGDNPVNKLLIVDEINRADIDKAFGQLFTLLSGQSVELPFQKDSKNIRLMSYKDYSDGDISVNQYIVPKSWRLIATLNTYDKASLYQMSYAFMRRFAFVHVPAPSASFIQEKWNEYLSCWKIHTPFKLARSFESIKEIWRSMNQDSKRPLGPAIVKDMLCYISVQAERYDVVDEGTEKGLVTNAVASFVLPQFEGLEKGDLDDLKKKINQYCLGDKIDSLCHEMFEG